MQNNSLKEVKAHMPGTVFTIEAHEGSQVKPGDIIIVIEAMKMEVDIKSPFTGKVSRINVAKGDQVSVGQVLALIEQGV